MINNFISLFYDNIDGISAHKCKDLLISTSSAEYDILVLTETWLDNIIHNNEFMDDQYEVFTKDRADSNITQAKGGRVLIGIKKNLRHDEIKFIDMGVLEAVCIQG